MTTNDGPERVMAQSYTALCELMLGSGSLHERLESACDALLSLESHQVAGSELRDEFVALMNAIFAVNEFERLTDEAASALALRVLSFREHVILTG